MAYTLTIGGQPSGEFATEAEAKQAYYKWVVANKADVGGPVSGTPEENIYAINGVRQYTDTTGRGTLESVESALFAVNTGKATKEQMDIVAGLTGQPTAASALNPDYTAAGQQASTGISPFEGGKTVDSTGAAVPMGTNQQQGAPSANAAYPTVIPTPPIPQSTSQSTPISSATLTAPAPLNYTTAAPPPAYPVSTLGATQTPGINAQGQMSLTPEEQKAQDFTTKLQDLNNQLIGKSAYTTQQETAQGIPELQKTKTDLSSKLNALKNEALAIPLQIQQDATGRGVTDAGVAPIQTAQLRNNAIQALTVNSLLEATNGNISTALMMVDRAVAQKYDPIKEQIDVAQRNLELILNSPQASIEDKNRALAQQEIQKAKAEQLAFDQENWKNIQKIAVDSAAAGLDATTLEKIQNAKSPTEAAQIAAANGVYKTPEQDQIQKIAVDAAAGGADAATLNKIQAAKTPIEAAMIAAQAGVYADKTPTGTSIITVGGEMRLINDQTGETIKVLGTESQTGSPASTSIVEVGGQKVLINDLTGETIKELGAADATQPGSNYQEISPGATVFDPETGKAVYTAPQTASQSGADNLNKPIGSAEVARLQALGYKDITPNMTQQQVNDAIASQVKPAAPSGYPTANLQPGSTDAAAVKQLQTWLVANGYMTATDMQTGPGIYGPKTTAAVAKVQQQYGVDNTGAVGYWGPKTLAALQGGAPSPAPKASSGSTTSTSAYTFKPSTTDISKVQQFAATNSTIDANKTKSDEQYFYWVLSQANSSGGRSE